jgi:cold shock CspA family protein
MSSSDAISNDMETSRLTGQVKWFNNKAGYGFITLTDGENGNKDIFIHYSSIRVTNSQYKYLVQGEYVEFNLVKSTNAAHEYQATDISGIKGGALMCETRRYVRPADDSAPRTVRRPRQSRDGDARPRNRDDKRSETKDDGFTPVRGKRPAGNRKPKTEGDDGSAN